MQLRVEHMSYGDQGIAHLDSGKTAFIQGAVTGDIAEVEIYEEKKRFVKARAKKILNANDNIHRINTEQSICPHIGKCGGCPWAQLSYDAQLEEKYTNIKAQLLHIANMSLHNAQALLKTCIPSKKQWGYRNKIELVCKTDNGKLCCGLHTQDTTNDLLSLDACPLFSGITASKTPIRAIQGALRYAYNAYDTPIERIGIRASKRTKDIQVALWTKPGNFSRKQVARVVKDATAAHSIVRPLYKGTQKARHITRVECLYGGPYWKEKIDEYDMELSAPSFFQVNTQGAETLIDLVLKTLDIQPNETAMDLYCGAGTFTLPLAQRAHHVFAVEASGFAVRDLKHNLMQQHFDNVEVIGGDTAQEFPRIPADVIVVDPPRQGLGPSVVKLLSQTKARSIAYVSCDPATLSRDLYTFEQKGVFRPTSITPVDLFPQTFHVETVTHLERIK